MTGRKKGKQNERRAAELYERAGYRPWRPQESKWGETDIYGLFDVMAVPGPGALGKVRLCQVKSNRAQGIEAWCEDACAYASKAVHVEFLVRYDGEPSAHTPGPRWRLLSPTEDGTGGYRTMVDERKDGTPADGEGVVEYLRGEA